MDKIKAEELVNAIKEFSKKTTIEIKEPPFIELTTPHFTKAKVYLKFLEYADIHRTATSEYTDIFKGEKLVLSVVETPLQIQYLVSVTEGKSDYDEDVLKDLRRSARAGQMRAQVKSVRLRL